MGTSMYSASWIAPSYTTSAHTKDIPPTLLSIGICLLADSRILHQLTSTGTIQIWTLWQCRTGNYNIERSRSNKWRDVFIMGLFSRTLKQSYLMYIFSHRDELSKRSHGAVFHYKLRQLSFSIQSDNKAMHAKLSSKPLQAIRNCEPSSTPSVPTGHYHSMQK